MLQEVCCHFEREFPTIGNALRRLLFFLEDFEAPLQRGVAAQDVLTGRGVEGRDAIVLERYRESSHQELIARHFLLFSRVWRRNPCAVPIVAEIITELICFEPEICICNGY